MNSYYIQLLKLFSFKIKNNFKLFYIIENLIEYLVYFIFISVIFKNYYVSLILLFLIIFTKYVYRNILILKSLIISHNFEYLIIKPINPLCQILADGSNLIDLFLEVIIFLIFIISFPKYILIYMSTIIILFSIYFLVISSLLFTYNKFSIEKMFSVIVLLFITVIIYSNSYVGLLSLPSQISSFLFSISLLFLSIKLWDHSLKKFL